MCVVYAVLTVHYSEAGGLAAGRLPARGPRASLQCLVSLLSESYGLVVTAFAARGSMSLTDGGVGPIIF